MVLVCWAEPPTIERALTYDDRGEFHKIVYATQDSIAPGVYLSGIGLQQLFQAYVVKVDSLGAPIWSRLWGTTNYMYNCLWQNGMGTLIGYTTEGNTNDYKLLLFNGTGSIQDQWVFGGNARADRAYGSMYYDSARVLVVGSVTPGDSSASDGSMVLVSGTGSVEWSRTFHHSAILRRIQKNESNQFVLFGTADSVAGRNRDFWVGRTDSVGNLLAEYRYGAGHSEELFDAVRVNANLSLLVGSTRSFGDSTRTNIFVMAINDNGDSLWSDVVGGSENDAGLCVLPVADRDSGFVIGGYWSESLLGTRNAFLMKYDQDFDSVWSLTRYDTVNATEFRDVALSADFRYHLAGTRFTNAPHGFYVQTSIDPAAPVQHQPDPFSLLSPADDAFFTVDTIRFTWQATVDPDPGDHIAYGLLFDTDTLFDNPLAIGPLQNPTYLLTRTDDIFDRYWRVVAQDQHSNLRICNERHRHIRKIRPDSTQAFNLLGPPNGQAIVSPAALFSWEEAIDPDSADEDIFYCLFFQVGDSISLIDTLPEPFANVNFTDHPFIHQSDTVTWWVTADSDYPEMTRMSTQTWMFINWNVSVEELALLPEEFSLQPAFPNPFNAAVSLRYTLAQSGEVNLSIFDVTGRLVTKLVEARQEPGVHGVQWQDVHAATGIYFARLVQGENVTSQKLLLLK